MGRTEYTFDGLDRMEKNLSQMIEQKYPAEFKKMVKQIAYELQGAAKKNTPIDTSHLRDNWKVGKIIKMGDEYYVEVYNNVEYAEPVEYGHRKKGGRGFVKGAHMMSISLNEINNRLPRYLREWIQDFISTHDL